MEIEMEEWKEYFKRLLAGVGNRVVGKRGEGGRKMERDLNREEVRKAIKKLKDGKAIETDGRFGNTERRG